jgi:hypothetical protein
MQKGMLDRTYKPCIFLRYSADIILTDAYFIVCKQDSFVQVHQSYSNASQCPETCHFFRSVTETAAVEQAQLRRYERAQKWNRVGNILGAPFSWFAKLSGIAQGLLILLVVVYFSPRIAEAIAIVVKALK